jgi:hypothetical protein
VKPAAPEPYWFGSGLGAALCGYAAKFAAVALLTRESLSAF